LTAGDGESSVIGRPNRPSPSCSKKTAPFPSCPRTDGSSSSRPRPRSGRTDGTVQNTDLNSLWDRPYCTKTGRKHLPTRPSPRDVAEPNRPGRTIPFSSFAVTLCDSYFPSNIGDPENWRKCEQISTHALTTLRHAQEVGIELAQMCRLRYNLAWYYRSRARFDDALEFYKAAWSGYKKNPVRSIQTRCPPSIT